MQAMSKNNLVGRCIRRANEGVMRKGVDTPGIEPGAFRLQSGRATTALCARSLTADTRTLHSASQTHTRAQTRFQAANALPQLLLSLRLA